MMQLNHTSQRALARRFAARGLLALVAGLSVTAAWSTQIVSMGDQKVVHPDPVARSTVPGSTTPAPTPAKPASHPASAPKR